MNRANVLFLILAGVILMAGSLFAGDTEVGGEIYARWKLALNDQSIAVAEQVKNYNNFEVTRAWINIQHTFSEKYSARLTTDLYNNGGQVDAFVQFAYLHINDLLPYTSMRFGLQEGVWANHVDKAWQLRYVDIASMEQFGFVDYADFGVSLYSTCPGNWGHLVLQVMNGAGANVHEVNKYKDITLFAELTPMSESPSWGQTALYAMYSQGYPNIAPLDGYSFADNTKKQRVAFGGKLAYKNWFTGYLDYFMASDDADIIGQPEGSDFPEEDKTSGTTLFAKINVAGEETSFLADVFVFAKFQFLDRHTDHDAVSVRLYAEEGDAKHLLAGAGYRLAEGLEMALTFKRTTEDRIEFDEDLEPLRIAETERNTFTVSFLASF